MEVKFSIVIPVKNESGNVEDIFRDFFDLSDNIELIFVDGNSIDNTLQIINEHSVLFSKVKEHSVLVVKQSGYGKGDAVWQGFQNSSGDVIGVFDADLTVSVKEFMKMMKLCEKSKKAIIGNRIHSGRPSGIKFPNYLYNLFISNFFNYACNMNVADILCGAKVFSRDDYLKIFNHRKFFSGHDKWGDLEILTSLNLFRIEIINFDVNYKDRKKGLSKISRIKDGFSLLVYVIEVFIKRKRFDVDH